MKLQTKEILFMIWGFLGSSILGSFFILSDLDYFTGNVALTADIIGGGLSGLVILGGVILFIAVVGHKIKKWKNNDILPYPK